MIKDPDLRRMHEALRAFKPRILSDFVGQRSGLAMIEEIDQRRDAEANHREAMKC